MNTWLMISISLLVAGVVGVITGWIFTYFDYFKKEDPENPDKDPNTKVNDYAKICGFAAIPAVAFGALTYFLLYKKYKKSIYQMSVKMQDTINKLSASNKTDILKEKVMLDPNVKCSTLKYDAPYNEISSEEFARHLNQDLNVVACLEREQGRVENIIREKLDRRQEFLKEYKVVSQEAAQNTAQEIANKYGITGTIRNPVSLIDQDAKVQRLQTELDALKTCGTHRDMIVHKTEEIDQIKNYMRTGKVPQPSIEEQDIMALMGERYSLGGYWPNPNKPDPVLREGAMENTSLEQTVYDRKHNKAEYLSNLQTGKPVKAYYDAYNTELGTKCKDVKSDPRLASVSREVGQQRKEMESDVFRKSNMAQSIIDEYSSRQGTNEYIIPPGKVQEIRKDMGWQVHKRKGLVGAVRDKFEETFFD